MIARVAPFVFALVAAAVGGLACQSVAYEPGRFTFDWPGDASVKPQVRRSLSQDFARDLDLLRSKVQDGVVVRAVRAANASRKPVDEAARFRLDERWRAASRDEAFVADLLDSECSDSLRLFRQTFPDFAEVFVTDARGGNVCLSNKTSDYYQGDEEWWQRTVRQKTPSHGILEYDESAGTAAVSIYVPVLDPDSRDVIGVGKGVIRRNVAARRPSS